MCIRDSSGRWSVAYVGPDGVALTAETRDLATNLLEDLDAHDALVVENRMLEKLATLPIDS